AVMERHALADLQGERLLVLRPFPRGRELRDDLQVLVDVHELVAQAREDDASHERARERGVEHVRVLGEPDAQRLRGGYGGGEGGGDGFRHGAIPPVERLESIHAGRDAKAACSFSRRASVRASFMVGRPTPSARISFQKWHATGWPSSETSGGSSLAQRSRA